MRALIHRDTGSGFSLLEVMVAVAILGIAVVALFQVFSSGLRGVKKSEDYTRAIIIARSLLDEAYAVKDPAGLDESLEFEGGFNASRDVEEIPDEDGRGAMYIITVRVTWGRNGSFLLKGRRFIPAADLATGGEGK